MTTAKRFYTYAELTHRSTAQLIPIYNRLFNTNIWEEMFNPYEARQEILMALFAEMRAQEILMLNPIEQIMSEHKPYRPFVITIMPDGIVLSWTHDKKKSMLKVSRDQMIMIRAFREDGMAYKMIAQAVGVPQISVFRVLKGEYANMSLT